MTDIELLIDYHKDAKRLGPGSNDVSYMAFQMTGHSSNSELKIADIGCGTGDQTLQIADACDAEIIAVDLYQEFLDTLNVRAKAAGMSQSITTRRESMDNLSFEKASLDMIWSEGAVYIMGFREGIRYWKQFIKPDGFLVVSDLTWFTEERPEEIEKHWLSEIPDITDVFIKNQQLSNAGYYDIAQFQLPPACWIDNYYQPMADRNIVFLEKHKHSPAAVALVEENMKEFELYKKYNKYFGYTMYVARV